MDDSNNPSNNDSDNEKSSENTSESDASDSDEFFDTNSALQDDDLDDISSKDSEDSENENEQAEDEESSHSPSNDSDNILSSESENSLSSESEDTEDDSGQPDTKNGDVLQNNGSAAVDLKKSSSGSSNKKPKFFINNTSKIDKNEESISNANKSVSYPSLPKWNSEKNVQDRQNTKQSFLLGGRYVWQSLSKNDQNEETTKNVNLFKEVEGKIGSKHFQKSNTIATGLNSPDEINSKGKTFSWHQYHSTSALAKQTVNSENLSASSENKKLSGKMLKTFDTLSFEEAKTGFTWNLKNKNSKNQTDVLKEVQTSKKPSDPCKDKVQKLLEKLKKLSKENSLLKEKPKQLKVALPMSQLKAKILKSYFDIEHGECLVHYKAEEKEAVMIGPENLVKEFQAQLALELKEIKEEEVEISKELLTILSGKKGKMYLKNLDLNGVLISVEGNSIKVAAIGKLFSTDTLQSVKTKLESQQSFACNVKIPSEKFSSLKFRLEQELLVHMDNKEKSIIIIGVPNDVISASKSVESFLDEIGDSEWTFSVCQPEAKFLFHLMADTIDSILKSVEILNKSITEERIDIKFKGSKTEVKKVSLSLQDIQKNIIKTVWPLHEDFKDYELFLIVKYFQIEKKHLLSPNYKDKYLFQFEISGSINIVKADLRNAQGDGNVLQSTPRKPEQAQASSSSSTSTFLTFDLGSSCQLRIKSEGDITREKSDILVSLVGTDIDMNKTSVGQSFSKLCPNHWKEVKAYHNSNPRAKIIIVQKPEGLKCIAVCHIILSPWNQRSSRAQLADAVGSVLDEAKCLGAKSVSFPPLGCGRMFKFPPSVVAEVMMESFKDKDIESFLQEVVVLAPDSTLFNHCKNNASRYFGNIPRGASQVVPDRGDSTPENDSMLFDDINIQSHRDVLHSAQIIIYTQRVADIGEIKIQKKREIKDEILQTDTIKTEILISWSEASWRRIQKEAIEHNVWIEKQKNPTTNNIELCLTGRREMLVHLKSFIQIELQNLTSCLPKNRLSSPHAPSRGTVQFLKYASESDEHFPSYWSLNNNDKYWEKVKEGKLIDHSMFNKLVDVDQATKDAITNLFINTQDRAKIGHGADAKGLRYSQLKVTDVKRVENPELFEKYRRERELLFRKMFKLGRICENIGRLPKSHGEVATVQWLPDFMKKELYYEINEHYLFHGAKSDAITTLVNNGLDPRVSNKSCMFGKGIYTAEKSTKADQYSDFKDKRVPNGTPLKIILTRMLLGNVYLCDNSHKSLASKDSNKLSRPPCMKCSEDICKCHDQLLYDSVIGNGHWIFREFVVYEGRYCYPEYVITYERV